MKVTFSNSHIRVWRITMLLLMVLAPVAFGHDIIPGTFVSGPTVIHNTYDYAAGGVFDGLWRQWWCSGVRRGDHIVYSDAPTVTGPWSPLRVGFGPSWRSDRFDGAHTCDPSVIQINGVYFLYYGGFPTSGSRLPKKTAVGVAWSFYSPDNFSRVFTNPIITPYNPNDSKRLYGAGQPSAIWLDNWVYLFYSDSTGQDGNPHNGGSVYCVRSRDAFFKVQVEELTSRGFVPRASTADLTREHSLWDAFSVDVQFIDATQQFVLLINGIPGTTSFRFFDKNLKYLPNLDLDIQGVNWREGGGFVRDGHGHALPHGSGSPDRMSLIWFYPAGGTTPLSWDVQYAGIDIIFRGASPASPARPQLKGKLSTTWAELKRNSD
jgi:hypothetical protein